MVDRLAARLGAIVTRRNPDGSAERDLRTTLMSAGMYTLTPDEHFVIASHPDHSAVTVAAGFSGHGFKFTTVVGEILADLAETGSTKHPIDFFSPTRFQYTL